MLHELATLAASALMATAAPVMTASQPWEQHAVFEPTVLYDVHRDSYRMWFSGGWDVCAMGYAESRDGAQWNVHEGPVLGAGVGGVAMACRNTIVRQAGQLYVYFTDGDGKTRVATGTDGIHWNVRQSPAIATPAWAPPGSTGIANTFVWVDRDGHWQMIYDVNMVDHWATGRAVGTSPYSFHDVGRLSAIDVGETSGAPWVVPEAGGYRLFYLASPKDGGPVLPTDIYSSWSADLVSWTAPSMLLEHSGSWWQTDQVADPSIANGLLFFDGVDNARAVAAIGVVRVTP